MIGILRFAVEQLEIKRYLLRPLRAQIIHAYIENAPFAAACGASCLQGLWLPTNHPSNER